jgi:hypothetical protein
LERNYHLAPTRPVGPSSMSENDAHIISGHCSLS